MKNSSSIDITIGIPVYNVEKYVKKCIESALIQDFNGNYEILIIDDRGNDNSMSIVENIIKEHPNGNLIRIIQHNENKGLGFARNTIIENALGSYLFFLDSDDWITPNCLSVLYDKAIETNSDLVVGSIFRYSEEKSEIIGCNKYKERTLYGDGVGLRIINQINDMHIEVWNKLYKLSVLKNNEIHCVHRIFEDYYFDFILRTSIKSISFISTTTLFYNIRSNSILTSLNNKINQESIVTFCDITKQMQNLLQTRFNNVNGILDLYFQRIIWVFEFFEKYDLIKEQYEYVYSNMKSYTFPIRTIQQLSNPRNRFIYKYVNKDNNIIDSFYKINKISKHPIIHYIFKIINTYNFYYERLFYNSKK